MRILLILALLLLPTPGWGAVALVTHTIKASSNSNGFTTDAIDTTGANFLVCVIATYAGTATNLADSQTNNWTPLTAYNYGSVYYVQTYYAKNATTNASHTFTLTATGLYPAMACSSYSGVDTTAPADKENGNNQAATTSIQPNSVTPATDGQLLVVGLVNNVALTGFSINSSFTTLDTINAGGGTNIALGVGYYIQPTAAAINPTISWTNSDGAAANIETFKAAAAGGAETFGFRRRLQQ